MSEILEKLVKELSSLTVLEMAELKGMLEDKWGVKAAAAVSAAPAAVATAAATAVVESTEFQVTLEKTSDDKKISVIKIVREISGLGLKESKDLVESAPKVLKPSCSKGEADEIVKKIIAAGGHATVKGL